MNNFFDDENLGRISKGANKKLLNLFSTISLIFNVTPSLFVNNVIFFIFVYHLFQLLFSQIFYSVFISSHILSWDSYVYICGVSLFINGFDPYNYITLRDCLPDNWNFYFNMPYTVLFLYLPFAKLTNFQWLFIVNGLNFFLLIVAFKKVFSFLSNLRNYVVGILLYFFFIFNTFDGAITVALYSGNLGVTISLIGLILLIDYLRDNDPKFIWFVVIATILKPIYICFAAAMFLNERNFISSAVKITKIVLVVVALYFLLYLINPTLFEGFLSNTAYLANSIDIGFGFTSLVREFCDRFGIYYSSITMLTIIGSILCLVHLLLIYYFVDITKYTLEEKVMIVSIVTLLFFPRIKVYDSLFCIPLISYLPFYLYNSYKGSGFSYDNVATYIHQRLHLVASILILYPLFIYNRWEPYHFTFILLFSAYLLIATIHFKQKEVKNLS